MTSPLRCIQVLSTKSSGSSVLQSLLCEYGGGRHVRHTRHAEFETLYWTKAASVLGLPQVRLPDSEVPIPFDTALRDLRTLILQNAPGFELPADNQALVFDGWRALCGAHAPVFVEKSPHHLHQRSCLQLMIEATERMPDIDFRFVALVRNPMDVMYSAWNRWRLLPERFQHHWRMAYENLERLKETLGPRVIVVRYEDLAETKGLAVDLLDRLGLTPMPGAESHIHGRSRRRWVTAGGFGFQIDDDVARVACRFGYSPDDMANARSVVWPLQRTMVRGWHRAVVRPIGRARRRLRARRPRA